MNSFAVDIQPDWQGLVSNIRREGTPERVYFIELFLDGEMQDVICERFEIGKDLNREDPFYPHRRYIAIQRFLGYDTVRCGMDGLDFPLHHIKTDDTAGLKRSSGRHYIDEHSGPISSWEDFENYPWPDPHKASTATMEWYSENLPEDMCIVLSGGYAHFCEYLTWLMGYEPLCYALYDQRDLVKAICDKLEEIFIVVSERLLKFDRVKLVWGSDDMGFRGGTLISPDDLREFCLPGHKTMTQMAHDAGRPYLLHSCGDLRSITEDLIEDVGIDAKHSFEDTIEQVTDAKREYGNRIALLGGIDLDFLCRSTEEQVRKRVRKTLDICQPGGGYCLGTGNSVANYIPVDNYLAMLDEGRKYSG